MLLMVKADNHRGAIMKPHHMLKKAASEHTEEYKRIIEAIMKR